MAGLRLYQWLAIASTIGGIFVASLDASPPATPFTVPGGALVGTALAMALLSAFAMAVDYPRSSRRFSRLGPSR